MENKTLVFGREFINANIEIREALEIGFNGFRELI